VGEPEVEGGEEDLDAFGGVELVAAGAGESP
jgi:hypothetical protein